MPRMVFMEKRSNTQMQTIQTLSAFNHGVSIRHALIVWIRIALLSFEVRQGRLPSCIVFKCKSSAG
jgi:hypothetical protein